MIYIDEVSWDNDGLVPAIAQDAESGVILMVAWMNREALQLTIDENRAIYWSRSRQKIWRKGEESGHIQELIELRLDCDSDAILMKVNQIENIACHTGRQSCFYRLFKDGKWKDFDKVIKDPKDIYR
jgi:phosphoribosyl-AMP cyclohydrolase